MTNAVNRERTTRVAIVTGGSRGVGRATVCRLAAARYAVVVNYLHDQQAAESAVEAMLTDDGDVIAVRADVADELDVQRLFTETITEFGRVDVVVHAVSSQSADIVTREAARHLRDGGVIVSLPGSAGVSQRPCQPDQAADVIAHLVSEAIGRP